MRRNTLFGLAPGIAFTALMAAGCSANQASITPPTPQANAAKATASAKISPTPSASASPSPSPTPSVDPGTLPQTHVLPGDTDAQFQAGAQELWQAIVRDKPELARPFFFPLSAYLQVKALSNPAEDYQNRLIAWYDLDIRAAHEHLGSGAANAKFVSLDVPEGSAEWIVPGVEYNKGSYYRVYGTRLNYQVNGHAASIGVFSLISWRGEWYVVHLGPSSRSSNEGIVYNPEG